MRPNQNKNRQRGRNGGRKHVNPLSRSFESNGPDVKVRGNAAHIAEKYLQLARDAQSSGDSVMAENYLQHAEHYFRIVSAAQQQMNPRPDGQAQESDDFDDDLPDMNSRFASPQPRQEQPQQNDGDEQNEGERADGQNQGQGERQDRQERSERRERPERGERRPRRERPVDGERPERQPRAEQPEQSEPVPAEASAPAAEAEAPAVEAGDGEARKPRERRPRRRRPAGGDAGTEGGEAGDVGELPAFLTGGANAAE
ncbi:DUF4167 domain-containing protein [Devosia sp. RR2S18]|uniref:DUF4167 domain-containing protein n=1 Tax=Devosia rhizosphaerae TaxID=3049774 RepID=UPI0025424485|nr:DUF4167 domain-containing protein [Devosia sp. RR2S18]WIJ25682.1 DUF4167 domain-containing protein [Devosia sp. RR2S18]